ncbi:MAG: hypothetical protein ABI557_06305 [Aureliella sp.]
MPIEFNCQVCRQRLSTPEGSAGRQCQCPDCGTLITIPASSRVVPSNSAASAQASISSSSFPKSAAGLAADSLQIPCPRCHFELVCSPSLLGTKGQCRNCQHIFTIPRSDSSQTDASESDSPDLVFHCPACAQLFAGQAEMEGKKGKCHACGEVFAIALEPVPVTPSGPIVSSPTVARPSAPRPSVASPPVKPLDKAVLISTTQRQDPIQFNCPSCSGVMEVPGSTSGQQTLCPYCGESLTIPAMSQSPRISTASMPVASAVSSAAPTNASASPTEQTMWNGLSDKTNAAQSNPYATPALSQFDPLSSQMWSAPTPRRKRVRGLTFSNAFELTFNSLFPFCLIAPVLFGMATVVALIAYLVLIFLARQTVRLLELTDVTSVQIVVFGLLAVAVLVGVLAATAAYCMTCNAALHAVRGKQISSRVVFNTGDAYGGVLAILLGWTIFNILRTIGVPYLMQEMARTGDLQAAKLTGISIIGILLLVQLVFTFLWSFVPYALLDGQGLFEAIGTSTSICLNHLFIVLPVLICGWLLYILVGIASIGLGMLLMIGALFYLNAAIYHLAED